MKKILIILILIIISATSALASDWRWLKISDGYYLDLLSITKYKENSYISPNIYSFWTKGFNDGTQEGKNLFEEAKKVSKENNLSFVMHQYLINCTTKKHALIAFANYDINNTAINSETFSKIYYVWESIIPETNMETLYNLICTTDT